MVVVHVNVESDDLHDHGDGMTMISDDNDGGGGGGDDDECNKEHF